MVFPVSKGQACGGSGSRERQRQSPLTPHSGNLRGLGWNAVGGGTLLRPPGQLFLSGPLLLGAPGPGNTPALADMTTAVWDVEPGAGRTREVRGRRRVTTQMYEMGAFSIESQ